MKKAIIGLVAGMLIGSAGMAAAATTQTVQATLAKFSFSINGEKQSLSNDPLVYKGSTYLPVREVAGLTGYEIEYDNATKSINLKSEVSSVAIETTQTNGYLIKARDLVELLASKYPEVISENHTAISLAQDGTLNLGDQTFKLITSGIYVDATPLVEANIIAAEELQ